MGSVMGPIEVDPVKPDPIVSLRSHMLQNSRPQKRAGGRRARGIALFVWILLFFARTTLVYRR